MKKNFFLSLLTLIVLGALLLTACGTPAAEPVAEEPMAEEPMEEEPVAEEPMAEEPMGLTGTVTIWHSLKDIEIEALSLVTEAFKAAYPDVTFDLLFVPDDDLRNKFETAAATGTGPDILIGSDDWGPALYDASLVADVSDLRTAELEAVANTAGLDEGAYAGAQVGLPYNLKGVIIYRNASIVPEAPTDVADLIAKAEAATSGDVYGAVIELGPFFVFGHIYGQGGALMTAEGDPAFNSPEGLAWMNMLKDFSELGPVSINSDNDVNLFKEGKVGIVVDGTWNISPLYDAIGDDLAIDPWPEGMAGFVQTKYLYLNYNSTGDNMTAAKAFMSFMLSTEAQTILVETDPGFIPVLSNVEFDDPLRSAALTTMSGGVPFLVIPEMGAYWGPSENAIRAVVDGTDPAEALSTAEEAINASITEIRGG